MNGGSGYLLPEYTLVNDNSICLDASTAGFSFQSIFGINLNNIYSSKYGITCKIIGYWTDDDEY